MKELEKKVVSPEKFSLLMNLLARINSELDLDTVLLEIIKAAKKLVDSDASSLMMYDHSTDELILSIPTGPATAEVSGKRFPADQGIAGWVVQNKESQLVNDPSGDSRFLGDFNSDVFRTRNLICVPMINQDDEVIGCLQALNKQDEEDFNSDDLFILQSLANQAAISIETTRLHQIRIENELLNKQLEVAGSIQSKLNPKNPPAIMGYDIAGTTRPARKVGGDYYDFIPLQGSGRWGFVVADVAGKGVPASLLMATVRTALRTQLVNNHPIRETIELVNKSIYEDSPSDKFITMFYGELNSEDHTLTYVNAGHNYPFLIDYNENDITPLSEGGLMLGVDKETTFDCNSITIDPGQQIVIFTDGITEAENEKGEMFGEESLKEWLLNHPDVTASELIALLLKKINNYQQSKEQSDDITVEVIRREEMPSDF